MNKRTLYAFLVSFLLLVIAIFLNQKSFDSMKEYTKSVAHSRDIITSFERLSNDFKSAQIYNPSYSNTSERNYYHLYLEEAKNVYFELMRLKNLAAGDSLQVRNVNVISSMIEEEMPVLMHNSMMEIIRSGEGARLTKLFEIHTKIKKSILYEEEVLKKLDTELKSSTATTNLLTILFSVIAIIIILLTFIFNVILARKGK